MTLVPAHPQWIGLHPVNLINLHHCAVANSIILLNIETKLWERKNGTACNRNSNIILGFIYLFIDQVKFYKAP